MYIVRVLPPTDSEQLEAMWQQYKVSQADIFDGERAVNVIYEFD